MKKHDLAKVNLIIGSLLYSVEAFAHGMTAEAVYMLLGGYFIIHILPLIYISFFSVKGEKWVFNIGLCIFLIALFWMVTNRVSDQLFFITLSLPMIQAVFVFFKRQKLKTLDS